MTLAEVLNDGLQLPGDVWTILYFVTLMIHTYRRYKYIIINKFLRCTAPH